MSVKKRGLGRNNLDALLSNTLGDEIGAMSVADGEKTKEHEEVLEIKTIVEIPIAVLKKGKCQPRENVEQSNLESLSASIKTEGILQPILVRQKIGDNQTTQYEIIAGERRFQAAKLAGLTTVPAIIRQVENEQALVMALVENVQRENLNPIDQAKALERLIKEHHVTQARLGELVGKSRPAVSNFLRLLTLNNDVKLFLANGDIDLGHAKVLLGLKEKAQSYAAETVVLQGLSVRATEKLVCKILKKSNTMASLQTQPKIEAITKDPEIVRLENSISDVLSAEVKIKHKTNGKGKLEIPYHSLEELEGILSHIK